MKAAIAVVQPVRSALHLVRDDGRPPEPPFAGKRGAVVTLGAGQRGRDGSDGVRAAAGRLFGRADVEAAGGSPIVVLSDALWARRFNRDPGVVGRTLSFNGFPLTVVGVAVEAFRGMTVLAPDAWIPAVMIPSLKRETLINFSQASGPLNWQLMVGARLARGATRRQAGDEVRAFGAAFEKSVPPRIALDLGAGVATSPADSSSV